MKMAYDPKTIHLLNHNTRKESNIWAIDPGSKYFKCGSQKLDNIYRYAINKHFCLKLSYLIDMMPSKRLFMFTL